MRSGGAHDAALQTSPQCEVSAGLHQTLQRLSTRIDGEGSEEAQRTHGEGNDGRNCGEHSESSIVSITRTEHFSEMGDAEREREREREMR